MFYKDQLKYYLINPGRFSILIIGERGTGKTQLIKELATESGNVVVANCAAFSDDTMAESELFGHKKGAFTGANENKKGLFEEADKGVLFLDEVHNLSKRVQEKLMTALQTEGSGKRKGMFMIRGLGESTPRYVSVRPVFASNLSIVELKKRLLPDLYDRISQLVLEIPSLKDRKLNLKKEFAKVWEEMLFEEENAIPILNTFYKWLNSLTLEGNYRTLQNIAINWHQGRLMKLSTEENVFDFVKTQILDYHTYDETVNKSFKFNFRKGSKKKEMEKEYRKAMYEWAKENYQGLTDKEIASILGFSRLDILLK